MKQITLRTNRPMPSIGFGTWQLRDEAATDAITAALQAGYRLIDTSGSYGNLAPVGQAVAGAGESGIRREDIFLVTKVEAHEDSFDSLRGQLKELGLDRVDLTLIHWPPAADSGDAAGVRLWKGLIKAHGEGMTTDIGVSNYDAGRIDELIRETGVVPAVDQIEWSPFGHSMEFRKYLQEKGIALQAYSPLAQFKKLNNQVLKEIGERHGKTPGQVVLRWDVQLGAVPLPRSGSVEHIAENFDVFGFELSDDEMARITGLNEHYSVIAGEHGLPGLNYL